MSMLTSGLETVEAGATAWRSIINANFQLIDGMFDVDWRSGTTTISPTSDRIIIAQSTGGNVILTLPNLTLCPGKDYIIIKQGAVNTITVNCYAEQTFADGSTSKTLSVNREVLHVISGANEQNYWYSLEMKESLMVNGGASGEKRLEILTPNSANSPNSLVMYHVRAAMIEQTPATFFTLPVGNNKGLRVTANVLANIYSGQYRGAEICEYDNVAFNSEGTVSLGSNPFANNTTFAGQGFNSGGHFTIEISGTNLLLKYGGINAHVVVMHSEVWVRELLN